MSKTGSANGSFFGNFIYNQLLGRRPHFLFDLSRAVDFSFVKAALKDFYVDPPGDSGFGKGASGERSAGQNCRRLAKDIAFWMLFPHERLIPGSGKEVLKVSPWVHTLVANIKDNISGVHHGVSPKNLPRYLAKFC